MALMPEAGIEEALRGMYDSFDFYLPKTPSLKSPNRGKTGVGVIAGRSRRPDLVVEAV